MIIQVNSSSQATSKVHQDARFCYYQFIMVYKATNTSEPKFQYFIWQEHQANCIFSSDERNFTHQWNTNLLGNKTHCTLITASPEIKSVCARVKMLHP
jgi:hypothetical protein